MNAGVITFDYERDFIPARDEYNNAYWALEAAIKNGGDTAKERAHFDAADKAFSPFRDEIDAVVKQNKGAQMNTGKEGIEKQNKLAGKRGEFIFSLVFVVVFVTLILAGASFLLGEFCLAGGWCF